LNVTVATSPLKIMKSSVETVTTKARSEPAPIVCLQAIDRTRWAIAEELELSNVIAADADEAVPNRRRRRRTPRNFAASGRNNHILGAHTVGLAVFMMGPL
jgi:hypothetical protein